MRIIPGFLLFTLATAAITAERIETLPEILAFHEKAVGEPLESLQLDLLIEEPEFTVNAHYAARRDPAMRIDVYADGERVFSEGLGDGGAWRWPGSAAGPSAASDDGAGKLLRGVHGNLYGLHERTGLGYKLSYVGTEECEDKSFWKVKSIAPDGAKEVFFINVESGLIERKEELTALHPDQDPRKVRMVTRFFDYRKLGSHWLSFASEKHDGSTGKLLSKVTIEQAELNRALPDAMFDASLN